MGKGQMGTKNRKNHEENDVFNKQNELKQGIKKIKWSQKKFARMHYCETHDTDNETEIENYCESFKKQLRRKTTDIERIETYLRFLYQTDEYRKSQTIRPLNTSSHMFEPTFNERMKRLSKSIDNQLREFDEETR